MEGTGKVDINIPLYKDGISRSKGLFVDVYKGNLTSIVKRLNSREIACFHITWLFVTHRSNKEPKSWPPKPPKQIFFTLFSANTRFVTPLTPTRNAPSTLPASMVNPIETTRFKGERLLPFHPVKHEWCAGAREVREVHKQENGWINRNIMKIEYLYQVYTHDTCYSQYSHNI